MKTMGFYQVIDNVGGCAITQLIPAQNRLTAALGFRNAYMLEKDPKKNPYQYKALELVEVTIADVQDDGMLYIHQSPQDMWSISGKDIIEFIETEMKNRGVDDFILDDDKEND